MVIISVFTLQIFCIAMVKFFYLRIFSASSFIIFVSPEIATSINVHISLSRIIMSVLFLGMFLTAFISSFHNVVTLPSRLVSTNYGTCSHLVLTDQFYPCFLPYVMAQLSQTPSCPFVYCSFANIEQTDTMWAIVL